MSRYYGGWAPYVPVAERRKKAEREMAKLAKKGQVILPVKLAGTKIASTFWGKAWCDNLESYHDYENRLPRGRTYVRNGSVVDLQIAPKEIRAMVSGSSIYRVSIDIGALSKKQWDAACRDCAGGIDSLVELLQGRFSKAVMERICRQDQGLFPKPSEIKFSCSCPDWASMCKHVAAVLYGVGARLDEKPELLFRLRAVDEKDMVANLDSALPLSKTGPAAGKVLEDEDISALFGLDMAGDDTSAAPSPKARARKMAAARTAVSRKAAKPAAAPVKAAGRKPAPADKVPAPAKPTRKTAKPAAKRKAAGKAATPAKKPAAKRKAAARPKTRGKVAT